MGNLYSDDIQNENTYPDEDILKDVRALINAGQREGTIVEYKSDISDKDNWPQAAASFANTFGGLIIFGVDAPQGRPQAMPGFDPKNIETKTRLVSTLLSHVQPRPEFQLRVVTHDKDQAKEIAVMRISEGSHPPYVYSAQQQHRVYMRVEAQKVEADYLQLSALFEKRGRVESQAGSLISDLTGVQSMLWVHEPWESNRISPHWYRFVVAPDDDRAARRLTNEVEHRFEQSIQELYGVAPIRKPVHRTREATYFERRVDDDTGQKFGIAAKGSLGFATHACRQLRSGSFFRLRSFCRDLITFQTLAASFYQKSQYYGGALLDVGICITSAAQLFDEDRYLFEPSLPSIQTDVFTTQVRIAPHVVTAEHRYERLEDVMNEVARAAGCVVARSFRTQLESFLTKP